MKILHKSKFWILAFVFSISFAACKSKAPESPVVIPDTSMVAAPVAPPEPVVIAVDDSLTNSVKDAVKDFPGVSTSISNGEITLTGSIKRAQLPKLMAGLHALHPKKINNNLSVN